jgi:hypothetical protein
MRFRMMCCAQKRKRIWTTGKWAVLVDLTPSTLVFIYKCLNVKNMTLRSRAWPNCGPMAQSGLIQASKLISISRWSSPPTSVQRRIGFINRIEE